jgi:biotin operon repressor
VPARDLDRDAAILAVARLAKKKRVVMPSLCDLAMLLESDRRTVWESVRRLRREGRLRTAPIDVHHNSRLAVIMVASEYTQGGGV